MPSNNGPLGTLPGMTFDPVRNRYFLTPIENPPPPTPPRPRGPPKGMLPPPRCFEGRLNKRVKATHPPQGHPARPKTGRMALASPRRAGAGTAHEMMQGRIWAGMDFDSAFKCGGCGGQNITSVKSYTGGAFHATTDHGEVIVHRRDKETHAIAVCAASLVGLHTDIARMTMMVVAAGPEAHVHHFRRDPENLDQVWMQHSELDLSQGDIYSMSSYDGACTLGSTRSLVTVTYEDTLRRSRRRIKSDALAVHHHDSNLVYAGLRNGEVSLEDLRVEPRGVNRVGHTIKGKAVVGVKRLKDSAVPWGLVVSGLDSELLLYDVRFPTTPMTQYHGHINRQYSDLGLDTTHDDQYLFAAGSDNRLRLYHTPTGRRIAPIDRERADMSKPDVLAHNRIGPNESNPLKRIFNDRITSISVREGECAVDLSSRGEISRFQWSETDEPADFEDWDLESMDEEDL